MVQLKAPPQMFQEQMVALTRAFGWHRPTHTPCGQPVSIAEAHAILELSKSTSTSQQELIAKIKLEKSSVSRLLAVLEGRGWVARKPNRVDGRARDVFLTAAGNATAETLSKARQRKMDSILEAVPLEQKQALIESLDVLIRAIEESDQ